MHFLQGAKMKLENYQMSCFNTTLMGVIKAVLKYYGYDYSDAMIFGGSGHAFLINIHKEICPSSPYVWHDDLFRNLLNNLGIDMIHLGFFTAENSLDDRKKVESELKEALNKNLPCALANLENQIITGYDEKQFFTAQPWPNNPDFPPATLTFETWDEFAEDVHCCFNYFNKIEPKDKQTIIKHSLKFALDIFNKPENFEAPDYGIGFNAYENWKKAILELGDSHGNWWNGIVWAENRKLASDYMKEIAGEFDGKKQELAKDLSGRYKDLSNILTEVSNKEISVQNKLELLEEAQQLEFRCVEKLKLLDSLI
jgi:hypothetical protein